MLAGAEARVYCGASWTTDAPLRETEVTIAHEDFEKGDAGGAVDALRIIEVVARELAPGETGWRRHRHGNLRLAAAWPRLQLRSALSRRGPPGLRRLGPEKPERAAGDEVALNIERVVDGSVSGQKALG